MLQPKFRLLLFAICSFCFGSWVGFYWRANTQATYLLVKNRGNLHSQSSNLREESPPPNLEKKRESAIDQRSCMPQKNVMFLKTHKTASTAVQNILLRYSEKNHLTVGLSKTYDIRFQYGKKFQESFVAKSEKPINIICHHMVFNLPEVQKVMPKTSSYITILREPASLFESMFDYFHYDSTPFSRVKQLPQSLEFWLDHPKMYFRGKNDGRFWWFAKNGVFFDMGYDNLSDDDTYIQNAIEELKSIFDLVMLSDYFSESMLLLKDHLCWSMEDILVLKTNARSSTGTELTDQVKNKIRAWNKADAAVYDHFNNTFWRKVEEYGYERMQKDLKLLDQMTKQLQERCVEGGAVSNKLIKDKSNKVYNPKGVVMKGYNIKESAKNDALCINLIKGEIQWTREMMAAAKRNGTRV